MTYHVKMYKDGCEGVIYSPVFKNFERTVKNPHERRSVGLPKHAAEFGGTINDGVIWHPHLNTTFTIDFESEEAYSYFILRFG